MCLEFSLVEHPVLRSIYDQYSFQVIPQIGAAVTGDRDSYQYLVESIRQFPPQKQFEVFRPLRRTKTLVFQRLTLCAETGYD